MKIWEIEQEYVTNWAEFRKLCKLESITPIITGAHVVLKCGNETANRFFDNGFLLTEI